MEWLGKVASSLLPTAMALPELVFQLAIDCEWESTTCTLDLIS